MQSFLLDLYSVELSTLYICKVLSVLDTSNVLQAPKAYADKTENVLSRREKCAIKEHVARELTNKERGGCATWVELSQRPVSSSTDPLPLLLRFQAFASMIHKLAVSETVHDQ